MRALKQTGSRNIEAALEYISKMGYLDPRNELIVRVIKQTSPGTNNLNKLTLASEYSFNFSRLHSLLVTFCNRSYFLSFQEKLACQTQWTTDLH